MVMNGDKKRTKILVIGTLRCNGIEPLGRNGVIMTVILLPLLRKYY
jgi:hypothetical protein